jgi:hypothetical protein
MVRGRAGGVHSCVNSHRKNWLVGVAFAGVTVCASLSGAQPSVHAVPLSGAHSSARATDSLPFGDGERLTFLIHTAKFGNVGKAVMTLAGPVDVRGVETSVASFDASAGVAFLKGKDATKSWIDLRRMTALRYEKTEHRPFSSARDSVEIYPDLHHWDAIHGDSGTTVSDAPLDDLSFIYFLRTVTLAPDSLYSFDRHYDQRRLPTTVRVVKHETLTTPMGAFNTVKYEMRMVDARDFKERGVLFLWISDDRCHLPIRIETVMAVLGDGIMTLQTAVTPNCRYTEDK